MLGDSAIKKLIILGGLFYLSACSHVVQFRNSYFNMPVTSHKQWGGRIAAGASAPTSVALINNYETNPPDHSIVNVNKNITWADLLLIPYIHFDFNLSVLPRVDLFAVNNLGGFTWQFLNHGAKKHQWVGSLRGAYGKWTSKSSKENGDRAESQITSSQAGLSLGYMIKDSVVTYLSYIHEAHDAITNVTNQYGVFPDYLDKGTNDYLSFGMGSHGPGLAWAIEYNFITIQWQRSELANQQTVGLNIGYGW